MAGSEHDDGHADSGAWILAVLVAAVVVFVLAGLLIRAVGADGAPVAAAHAEPAGSEPAAPAPTTVADAPVGSPSTTAAVGPTVAESTTTAAAPAAEPSTTEAAAPGGDTAPQATTPVPAPAAPSARPGGDDADASESAAAVAFAQLVRRYCDLSGVPDPGQVRSTSLGDGFFQIVDANGIVLQLDVATSVVTSADSLDGTVPGGYSTSCAAALFGG
jgi:cytoskeletal protein RodZ